MDKTNRRGAHSLQVVSRRTGLTPHAIHQLEPRHRDRWTDAEVERLLMLARLVRLGRDAEALRHRDDDELATLIALAEAQAAEGTRTGRLAAPGAPVLDRAVEAILATRTAELHRLLEASLATVGRSQLLRTLLIPLTVRLAELEAAGTLRPFHEHLAAACVDGILAPDGPVHGSSTLALATPSGESHELEMLVAAEVAREAGYRVRRLGTSVPILRLAALAERDPVPLVLVISRPPAQDLLVEEMTFLVGRWQGGPLLLHGRRAGTVGEAIARKLEQRPSPRPAVPVHVAPTAADLEAALGPEPPRADASPDPTSRPPSLSRPRPGAPEGAPESRPVPLRAARTDRTPAGAPDPEPRDGSATFEAPELHRSYP